MNSEWPLHSLSDFINVKHGFAFKGEFFKAERTSDLLVTPGNFAIGGGFKSDKFKFYDGPVPEDYVLSEGDLIVTMTDLSKQADTLGYSALVPAIAGSRLLHNQRVGLVEFKNDELDITYLYFLLRSKEYRHHVVSTATGSTVKHTSPTKILSFAFRKPPKDIQIDIGKKLIALEEKIENNTQTNQTLEQIAQAIFKSWFVDFDPVKAKIETLAAGGSADDAELAAIRVISAKTIDELNTLKASNPEVFNKLAQTAALFPAAMQDSELGEIPEGWSVSSLSELIKITGGGTPKRSEELYWNGNIPWFSVKDVPTEGNVFVVDTDEKITELGLNKSSTKLLPKGTTIITARGTVGKLALVGTDMCMNQSCYGILGKSVGDFYNYFNLKEAVSTLQRNTHGAVFDTITTQTFDTYSLAFSGVELANKFDALVAPLLQNIETNVRQNIELATLRDTLLPKLLSGEIDLTSEVTA
ncbi:restriction endonuclease subunit S [Vibrio vulnificus]